MAPIATTSRPGRLPVSDGRSLEARYLKRVRSGLIAQCGRSPSASQRLLIDRVAVIALRVFLIDGEPALADSAEYLGLIRLQADLLAQLGDQPAPSSIVHRQRSAGLIGSIYLLATK